MHAGKPELSKWHVSASLGIKEIATQLWPLVSEAQDGHAVNTAEVEYCTQGQVLFKSWTSPVIQGRAAASSSGYDGVKTACKTLQMKD